MSVYDLVMKRRTVRKFQQQPVPRDLMERLLDAGRMAPTGGNWQTLEFVAVDDPEVCAQIFPHTAWAGYLENGAPKPGEEPAAYVVILHNMSLRTEPPGTDIGFAAENIILTALDEGVASCAIGALQRKPIEETLDLPEKHAVALVIALGYPAEEPVVEEGAEDPVHYWRDENGVHHVPKRPREQVTHRNRFEKR